MISKEELSAVLGETVINITNDRDEIEEEYGEYSRPNDILVEYANPAYRSYQLLSTYELAHMVKKWAVTKGFTIESNITMCKSAMAFYMTDDGVEHSIEADTEPEAIFKAGEWILKEISK